MAANVVRSDASSTEVALDFESYRSFVVVFAKNSTAPSQPQLADGELIDLNSDWTVKYGSAMPTTLSKLKSWADDEATRHFSGEATYERNIDITDAFLRNGKAVVLDFGESVLLPEQNLRNGMRTWLEPPIREAAVIYINGERAGSLWSPPYRLDVSSMLKMGENKIKVVVGNTALNYMAGRRLPDYKLLNLRYGERFQPQEMEKIQVLPSGLTGNVRLVKLN
ncbi:MAG TPA: hypothetical protein PKA82_16530 [Pyrinomonadaceae bacterium]|nr:hypothetical protein [Pyrinomonadaceae bacterium]